MLRSVTVFTPITFRSLATTSLHVLLGLLPIIVLQGLYYVTLSIVFSCLHLITCPCTLYRVPCPHTSVSLTISKFIRFLISSSSSWVLYYSQSCSVIYSYFSFYSTYYYRTYCFISLFESLLSLLLIKF